MQNARQFGKPLLLMGKILCGSKKMEGGNKKKNQDDEINDIDQEPKP